METINQTHLLDNTTTKLYDLVKTKEGVEKLISELKRVIFKYDHIDEPKITTNFEMNFTSNNQRIDKIHNYVSKKVESEKEVVFLYNKIKNIYDKFTKEEKIYYTLHFFENISEEAISERLLLSRVGLRPIKNSCILKIALAFDIEIEK